MHKNENGYQNYRHISFNKNVKKIKLTLNRKIVYYLQNKNYLTKYDLLFVIKKVLALKITFFALGDFIQSL